jgi:hypothetical protein
MSLDSIPTDLFGEIACFLDFQNALTFAIISKQAYSDFKCQHDPRIDEQFAVKKASEAGNVNAIMCLLKVEFVDFAVDNNYPFRKSSSIGNVKALIQNTKVDPAVDNNVALRNAAYFIRIDSF